MRKKQIPFLDMLERFSHRNTYILYFFIHGKIFSAYYNKKFYYNYTVLQDCRVGAQPGATI